MAVFGRVLDGLSGLAGIFIKYIYAGCGTSLKSYSTPVYRKFEKPVTTRQPVKKMPGKGIKKRCAFSATALICVFLTNKTRHYRFFGIGFLLLTIV